MFCKNIVLTSRNHVLHHHLHYREFKIMFKKVDQPSPWKAASQFFLPQLFLHSLFQILQQIFLHLLPLPGQLLSVHLLFTANQSKFLLCHTHLSLFLLILTHQLPKKIPVQELPRQLHFLSHSIYLLSSLLIRRDL